MSIKFGRETCCNLEAAEKREWLVTNGIGGFASGTVAGLLTRRYHGLLIAALNSPLGRNLLVAKVDETVSYGGKKYTLGANRWADGSIDPKGYINIESFYLDGAIPVWSYACANAIIEKRVWMKQGSNTTYIRYEVKRASGDIDLDIKAYVNYRDYHGTTHAGNWKMVVQEIKNGIRINPYDGARPFYILADNANMKQVNVWYYGFNLAREEYRGLDHTDDHLHAATLISTLREGQSVTVIAGTDGASDTDGNRELDIRLAYERELTRKFGARKNKYSSNFSPYTDQLALAADQFIVGRPLPEQEDGKTVIAGYHWFGDWGRDTMISLPGLTIHSGRPEIAGSILRTFARFVDKGMLPNRFPDGGEAPEYNTVDAALWYFEAVRAYFEDTEDISFLEEIFPVLEGIIDWHYNGTRYGIKVDPKDGLLHAGETGVQLTWMDAKVGDMVITPRTGKPVEVNALWYNALASMSALAKALKKPSTQYLSAAKRTLAGFSRFWNEEKGYCYDVIDGPAGNDASLRPNQILAVSLRESPLNPDRQKQVVESCALSLLTSFGLRSLSPDDPGYRGHYGGDQRSRDGAYHQGTVWGWLLGHFALAHMKVYKDPEKAARLLEPMLEQLRTYGVGTLGEIFDGEAPMTPRGCIAQAWTVAETIRALVEIGKYRG